MQVADTMFGVCRLQKRDTNIFVGYWEGLVFWGDIWILQDPKAESQISLWRDIWGPDDDHQVLVGEDIGLWDTLGEQWRGTSRTLEWEKSRGEMPELGETLVPEVRRGRAWRWGTPEIHRTLEQSQGRRDHWTLKTPWVIRKQNPRMQALHEPQDPHQPRERKPPKPQSVETREADLL